MIRQGTWDKSTPQNATRDEKRRCYARRWRGRTGGGTRMMMTDGTSGRKSWRTVTSLTASGLVHSLSLWNKFKCDDWGRRLRPVTAGRRILQCLWHDDNRLPCQDSIALKREQLISLHTKTLTVFIEKPLFTGCVNQPRQGIQQGF